MSAAQHDKPLCPGWLRQTIIDAVASFTKQPYVPQFVRQELKAAAREIRKSKLLRSQSPETRSCDGTDVK